MDKNRKHHREKTIPAEELADFSPPGASFSTEEGRVAQGMRPDIGVDQTTEDQPSPQPPPSKERTLRADSD